MVEDQGYEIVDVRDSDRTEAGMRLEMRLTSALRRRDDGTVPLTAHNGTV